LQQLGRLVNLEIYFNFAKKYGATTRVNLFIVLFGVLIGGCGSCFAQTPAHDELSAAHREVVKAFVQNYRTSTPITPIPEGSLTEDEAYEIADAYVNELMTTEGSVGGYKVGTFEAGMYDDGPVDDWSGPVTAIMFSNGLHQSGHHVSVSCCNFSFVEADFAAEVGSDSINDAITDLELLAALKGFHPFIEMPDILTTASGGSKFAGVATNYDFRTGIIGDLIRVPATQTSLDRLNAFNYTMTNEHGDVLGVGDIRDAYEPIYRVRTIRDRILKRGRRLKAGDILSLGNMGTIRPLTPGGIMLERPRFEGNIGTVTYYNLAENGPASVSVHIDR
jgi:2-keto-4-pentenoate hydratase